MRPPPSFYGFLGQTEIVDSLRRHVDGALRQGVPLPHIGLYGSSGMGKTALSKAVAKAMGTDAHEVYCGPETKRMHLVERLASIKRADLLFLDEVHALRDGGVSEILYPAIDRQKAPLIRDGRLVENEWIDIPAFTLVIATDQPGRLANALRQRIVLPLNLSLYCQREMRIIVASRAAQIGLLLSSQSTTRLADATRGVPRRAGHLLASLKTCIGDAEREITKRQVSQHLASMGIDDDNLTDLDRRYLSMLAANPDAHVALTSLALNLGTDEDSIRRDIETYLVQRGLVLVESSGRRLSTAGIEFVKERRDK